MKILLNWIKKKLQNIGLQWLKKPWFDQKPTKIHG
jgi:hypothetical protein